MAAGIGMKSHCNPALDSAKVAGRAPAWEWTLDLTGRGWQDLFVSNVDHEMFSVYENNKDETFRDVAQSNGVAKSTRLLSGWGLKYFDYDNDGGVDLFLANGHPDDMIDSYSMHVKYKEPLLLFHHGADGKLHD